MSEADDSYILGTDASESRRLARQHRAWIEQMYSLLGRAGLKCGATVVDLGCGPGLTTFDLAHFVGLKGRVIGTDESRVFIEELISESERRGLTQVAGQVCSVESLDLEPASIDAAYGRWILSWLSDPTGVLEQIAQALRPGGFYALQEYLNWGTMNMLPKSEAFDGGVAACLESWRQGGGMINASVPIPALASKLGLVVEHFEVVTRSGSPGPLVWTWLDEFYRNYLPRLVERGIMTTEAFSAFFESWERAGEDSNSQVIAPTMADIILRKA